MGSNRLITKDESKVEYTSLTNLFEKQCPIYMSFGMTYDEFWYGEPYRAKFYRESYKLKVRQKDEELWIQGMYIYEALCKVSPILHAFSKKGTKPLQYAEKPYLADRLREKTKEEIEQEKENERLKFIIQMNNWFQATTDHFKNTK